MNARYISVFVLVVAYSRTSGAQEQTWASEGTSTTSADTWHRQADIDDGARGFAGSSVVDVVETDMVTAFDAEAFDQFGMSVALSGDTAVIGDLW